MSRHGYSDDLEPQDIAMWRGRVMSAIRGKRGQKMLRELAAALDSMPIKELVACQLQSKDGDCCTLGRLAQAKGLDLTEHADDDEYELAELNAGLAAMFDVAECLVQEVEWANDECGGDETPAKRWERMRRWVDRHLAKPEVA